MKFFLKFMFVFSFIEIETSFMPWLMEKTMTQVNQLVLGRTILDSIIRDVVNQRIDDYEKLAETLRQVKIVFFKNSHIDSSFYSKAIEGGVEIGTSTQDITHGSELNTERPESASGELIVTTENNTNGAEETHTSALPKGNIF
jgi:hypothetical protein